MAVSITRVAAIMRAFGAKKNNAEWEQGALLQDIWFSNSSHTASPIAPDLFDFSNVAPPDQTGIRIDWILQDSVDADGRARKAFAHLQSLIREDNPDVREFIERHVNQGFAETAENTVELGAVGWSAGEQARAFHAQRVAFSSVVTQLATTPIDPLIGSLGSFNFYAVPVGVARRKVDGTVSVEIGNVVVYVLDSYDFEGEQALGCFEEPDEISRDALAGTVIWNADYRNWRNSPEAQNKGGDFLVMSDAKTMPLPLNFSFTPAPTANGTWVTTDAKHRFKLAIRGNRVEWTETGPETGQVLTRTLELTAQLDGWRIERPNNENEVLKLLGFANAELRQAILANGPRKSTLMLKPNGSTLDAVWRGIRVSKSPDGKFKSLTQPDDPANLPGNYNLQRG